MTAARQDSSSKPVLDVMRALLDEGANEQVLGLVAELVARNEALELALAKKLRAFKTTEKVSPGQLALFLEKVANDEAADSDSSAEASTPTSGLMELVTDERQRQALYLFAPSGHATFSDRHTIGPADFLALRSGLTVADAASVFDQAFARDDIIECGCNMHARRYFVKALDGGRQPSRPRPRCIPVAVRD